MHSMVTKGVGDHLPTTARFDNRPFSSFEAESSMHEHPLQSSQDPRHAACVKDARLAAAASPRWVHAAVLLHERLLAVAFD